MICILFLASFFVLSCAIWGRLTPFIQKRIATVAKDAGADADATSVPSAPLKVFILVGQSNMEGHGYMDTKDDEGNFRNGTLEWMVETDPETYGKLKNNNTDDNDDDDDVDDGTSYKPSNWTQRDDVWIAYN